MKGNIIGFDPDTNTGAISGHDGNRYDFVRQDWHGHNQPRHGDVVDFQAIGEHAYDIYLIEPEYVSPGFWTFYFSAAGRISRSQYWLRFCLPYFVIGLVLQISVGISGESSVAHSALSSLLTIFSLVVIWPTIVILIKRIHDRNKSGWLCLALYGPMILAFILMFAWLADAIIAAAAGKDVSPPEINAVGVSAIILLIVSMIVSLWFFVEFGCLRGTIGANRYGPDPVR
jgi:uncharacterized membrane protein YhaH (DUF805 family)